MLTQNRGRIIKKKKHMWLLGDSNFEKIVEEFGTSKIDLFASRTNTKCKTFISWFRDPEVFAIDAFTASWKTF